MKKKNGYKNMNFAPKEKFILWQSSCFELFGDGKYALFLIQIVDVRWYFLQHGIPCFLNTEKVYFWTFRRWEIQSSFDLKSWFKMIFSSAWNTMFFEYGKSSYFELFRDRKCGLFLSKKLMESWYFLCTSELFMIF